MMEVKICLIEIFFKKMNEITRKTLDVNYYYFFLFCKVSFFTNICCRADGAWWVNIQSADNN